MFLNIIIGVAIIAVTVTIQALGTVFWVKKIDKYHQDVKPEGFGIKNMHLLITTAFFLMILIFVEASIWALVYYIHPQITEFETFEQAIYFSIVTFTTLGYGDITMGPLNRMLSSLEAINGGLLIGWSTAFMFVIVQQIIISSRNIDNKKMD